MPKIKISHIISFSSEDPNFPASNLLKSENYRKWKCKEPGEKEASVLLQLEKAVQIDSIDIGNECSAFVEILVGRSSQSSDEFKVLLLTSSFMSPMDSRNITNTNRVRMFSSDKLDGSSVKEKWDRVKIVCTQPFNKHIQYGLSFINLHSPPEKAECKTPLMFGKFALKDEEKDDIKAGSLFDGYKGKQVVDVLKGAAAIREASTSEKVFSSKAQNETKALLKEIEKKNKPDQKHDLPLQKKNAAEVNSRQKGGFSPNKATSSDHLPLNSKKEKTSEQETKETQKRNPSPEIAYHHMKKIKKEHKDPKKLQRKPFNKLLEGVVFVISGFQNPLRGNIRSQGLEMGAKYKPDWENSCTHLICAFPNTPKYMQVLGKGHIVSKEWIEDSYAQRKRLPWRRYAMAKHEKGKEESEEEILEEIGETSAEQEMTEDYYGADRGAPSGSDTDDEIQRCMEKTEKHGEQADDRPRSRTSECYNCETEEENEEKDHGSPIHNGKLCLSPSPLPDFFHNFIFYISSQVDSETRDELKRHIVAYKGKIATSLSEEVTHFLCEKMDNITKFTTNHPNVKLLNLQWIWDCNDAGSVVPMEKYLIRKL